MVWPIVRSFNLCKPVREISYCWNPRFFGWKVHGEPSVLHLIPRFTIISTCIHTTAREREREGKINGNQATSK